MEFALKIGRSKGALRKNITVTSNDPQTPRSVLSIKANSMPLYEATPASLVANVPAGGRESNLSISLARTDGEPLRIQRVDTSKPWIVAKIDPAFKARDAARIQIEARGDGVPRRFNELVDVYADDKIDTPVASIPVFGQIIGELTFSPEKLFWRITNSARVMDKRLADIYTRRLTIRSSAGREFELKNAQSSIKELDVEINAVDGGKAYEIVAKLVDLTAKSIVGTITFETSLASMPKVEVPVAISVFQKPLSGDSSFRPLSKVVDRAVSTGTVQDATATPAPLSLPVLTQ